MSVPLFQLAINDIKKCVTFPPTKRLFADDFSLSLQSSNPSRAARLLQQTLNILSAWATERGFRFSSQKTKLVIFRKHRRSSNTLHLQVLQNFSIQIVNSYKFLGLTFYDKLSWIFYIKELKAKCLNKILILKYLFHTRTRCNRKLLLQLIQKPHPLLTRLRVTHIQPDVQICSQPIKNHSDIIS